MIDISHINFILKNEFIFKFAFTVLKKYADDIDIWKYRYRNFVIHVVVSQEVLARCFDNYACVKNIFHATPKRGSGRGNKK